MRTYVITVQTDDPCGPVQNVGVKSNRKAAIEACVEVFGIIAPGQEVQWTQLDKHYGSACVGGTIVTFRMFMNNELDTSELGWFEEDEGV